MDIKLLISFMEIVRTESFSEAAENLFITQSALSKQMARLENEIRANLFDRSRRKATLTDQGLILSEEAPKIISGYQQLQKRLSQQNCLKLGVFPSASQYGGMRLIAGFSRQYPGIDITTVELENARMAQAINDGTVDLAICRLNDNSAFKNLVISSDTIALIVSADDPRARQTTAVSLAEFSREKFIFLSDKTGLYELSKKCCERAGFTPNIVFTGDSGDTIAQLVETGVGVAMIMKRVALSLNNPALAVLDFIETETRYITLSAPSDRALTDSETLFWAYTAHYLEQPE